MADSPYSAALKTTIIKKVLMGATGLGLVIFVLVHMLGNLTFLFGGPDAFNSYSHKLISLGPLLYLIEAGLVLFFLVHAWSGIQVTLLNRRSRNVRYKSSGNAGGVSKKGASSLSMIYTGVILFVFTVIHVRTFKYGPWYETTVDGVVMRDIFRLVAETFTNPLYAFGYAFVMVLLGLHLRHGFWSAFQSLGANHPRYSGAIYTAGAVIAVLLVVGFVLVPLYAFFVPQTALITAN